MRSRYRLVSLSESDKGPTLVGTCKEGAPEDSVVVKSSFSSIAIDFSGDLVSREFKEGGRPF
jgi:hypothetical protein